MGAFLSTHVRPCGLPRSARSRCPRGGTSTIHEYVYLRYHSIFFFGIISRVKDALGTLRLCCDACLPSTMHSCLSFRDLFWRHDSILWSWQLPRGYRCFALRAVFLAAFLPAWILCFASLALFQRRCSCARLISLCSPSHCSFFSSAFIVFPSLGGPKFQFLALTRPP